MAAYNLVVLSKILRRKGRLLHDTVHGLGGDVVRLLLPHVAAWIADRRTSSSRVRCSTTAPSLSTTIRSAEEKLNQRLQISGPEHLPASTSVRSLCAVKVLVWGFSCKSEFTVRNISAPQPRGLDGPDVLAELLRSPCNHVGLRLEMPYAKD